MESLIKLYKDLDAINLIIFWGIVIVIVLIIILVIIMISKNKKIKKTIKFQEQKENDIDYEEELPIKQEEPFLENQSVEFPETNVETYDENPVYEQPYDEIFEPIQEELPIKQEEFENLPSLSKEPTSYLEEQKENNKYVSKPIEMPTAPYQRNVLREMSLSQTSPIGINRKEIYEEKKKEMIEDLSTSLNYQYNDEYVEEIHKTVTKELSNIEDISPRKTEIIGNSLNEDIYIKPVNNQQTLTSTVDLPQELLEIQTELKPEPNNNDKYLEEVSKKLSEAEVSEDIERTNYEIQQEEDAIISYTELMEKKDSIKTIDEEDAVISIEELMNRENHKNQEPEIDSKLYNINENEENDRFIKELKQFRNDL